MEMSVSQIEKRLWHKRRNKFSLNPVSVRILEVLKIRSRISPPTFITLTCVKWAIPEKIQTGGFEDILFWKPPWNFSFFYFTPGNPRQSKTQPLDIPKHCVRFLGNSKAKNKDPWKFQIFFLVTLGSFTSFLITPWKFHMLISLIPLEIPYPQPPLFAFFLE